MANPSLGLAASVRDWSDRLHRFILDHGGASVAGRVMSSDQAIDGSFEVLLIDDICSFLTPRLVSDLRSRMVAVVGVYSPDDGPDAKRRLLDVGITDVIESEASPDEFLTLVRSTLSHRPAPSRKHSDVTRRGVCIGVVGPPGGVGVTEIACALALELATRAPAVLVDLNQTWPGVSQRLNLPLHPNLRSAIDFALHEPNRLPEACHRVGPMTVIGGLANPEAGPISVANTATLVGAITENALHIVLDLGQVSADQPDLLIRRCDAVLVVGTADPMSLVRLVRTFNWVGEARSDTQGIGVVVNRSPGSFQRRLEIRSHLDSTIGDASVVLVPFDKRVERAAWDGKPVPDGSFNRSIRRLAGVFAGESSYGG